MTSTSSYAVYSPKTSHSAPSPRVIPATEVTSPFADEAAAEPLPASLNSIEHTPEGTEIPGVLFAIPFPHPHNAVDNPKRPSFLLYAPPRAMYSLPTPSPDAPDTPISTAPPASPKAKPSLTKKLEQKWQSEVHPGEALHEGTETTDSRWRKAKGEVARRAQKVIRYLPSSDIEALARVPPGRKMHTALVFTPADDEKEAWWDSGDEERELEMEGQGGMHAKREKPGQKELDKQLLITKKAAVKRTMISGVLLPVTGAFDWIVPIFSFEVDVAYFSSQLQGLRKATALTNGNVDLSLEPSPHLKGVKSRLDELCRDLSPAHFPASPRGAPAVKEHSYALADGVIRQMRESVSDEVAQRHNLDPKIVAEDLERCLRKGAKEFVKTL